MPLSSERRSFEKAVLKAIPSNLKGTGWKKAKNAIFCESGGFYIDVVLSVHLNATTTVAEMAAKPMSLDRVYWKVTDLNYNSAEPLSFRTWGAFTCPGLPVAEKAFADGELSANELAALVIDWANAQRTATLSDITEQSFSELVAQHPNQVERGAYAVSYVTSLIDEGDLDMARKIAASYSDGSAKSVCSHTHLGKDFHEIAAQWIDSGETG